MGLGAAGLPAMAAVQGLEWNGAGPLSAGATAPKGTARGATASEGTASKATASEGPLPLGIAGYTFLQVPVDGAIAIMQRVGVTALSIKDFYLPLDSPPETIQTVVEKFRSNGIRIYAAGVIYMKTVSDVDRAFAYARALGVGLIVGVPNPELLSYTEQKVRDTDIRVAIHNHGPEDKLYPSPVDVYNHIKNLDPRMGLCLDIGHAARAGADPVKVMDDYAARIFDLHVKDLAVISKEAKPIELGRGVLDIPGLVKALIRNRYTGYCSIEHEMDMSDPLPGIAESVGYFRGVRSATSGPASST
jgi:sugar phosphate isomerase/epimerase